MALEIERKFLVRLTDELIGHADRTLEIEQVYLKRNSPAVQRRIRRITENGESAYYYTEKVFISAVTREEREKAVSEEEYRRLYREIDPDSRPVIKTRRIINWQGQRFELDSYSFSDTLATIELELANENQPIDLPPFAQVIKEVTGLPEYSNGAMAKSGSIPAKGV